MLFSNKRKLQLSGWLQENNREVYCSPLKLQKFLFLYELFSKMDEDEPDFDHLKGYKRGPVFSNVWGDYKNDRSEFDYTSRVSYVSDKNMINTKRAQKAAFIVTTLTENELSNLTHLFHIWSAKEKRIMADEQQVNLDVTDFNENDKKIVAQIDALYTDELIQNNRVISIGEKNFVFSPEDYKKITEQHRDVLSQLSENNEIRNPVFVEIDKRGRLVVD